MNFRSNSQDSITFRILVTDHYDPQRLVTDFGLEVLEERLDATIFDEMSYRQDLVACICVDPGCAVGDLFVSQEVL